MAERDLNWGHDLGAGALTALVGLGAVLIARTYGIGTLQEMQPGLFPSAVGVMLIGVGAVLCIGAMRARARQPRPRRARIAMPDWRGWIFIVAGVLAFLFLGEHGGLLPAAFGCVFLSALGTRTMRWRQAFVLALCVASAGSVFFSYVLKVQMPLLTWAQL